MKQPYIKRFIFLLMALLIVFATYLQYTIVISTDKLKKEELEKSEQFAHKIAEFIQFKAPNGIEQRLTQDSALREQLNEVLQAFLTKQYRYMFVLTRDQNGHYRFLLDGSKENPVEYKTLFFPQSNLFDFVYASKKMKIVKQHEGVEEVWLSLVYPIVYQNRTEALLVMDLSKEYGEHLSNFNSPLMHVARLMQIFLVISLSLLIILIYRYYRFQKTLFIDKLTSAYTKLYPEEFFRTHKLDEYNTMFVDIDEFKRINTKFGYTSGDSVIKVFVETMYGVLPPDSLVVRIGGTEFLVIVSKSSRDMEVLTEELFARLLKKHYLIGDDDVVSLTVSISSMIIPHGTSSIKHVMRLLDEKMLEIKSRGKNNFAVIGAAHFDEVKYGDIDYIKEALEAQRLCCLYQPIFHTKSRKIVKYEALVRLIDDKDPQKLISPFHFMKVIKGTSQYIKMSKQVLEIVFDTLCNYCDIEITVNIDLDDLYHSEMMELIQNYLYQYKEIAYRLTFEILEDHEIVDYDRVNAIFNQLKVYGSKIAIDDFGSGYANYRYFIRLYVDILKIDGSLIVELNPNHERTKIVLNSINKLALEFQYEVVAEFVSDEKIYEAVKSLDIKYSQGYYLGEPKPIEAYLGADT